MFINHIVTGNLKIVSDSRIRKIVSKGPKYRFLSYINFDKCREEIAYALNDFGNRWCKRESVEDNALKEWKRSIFTIVDKRIKFYSQNTYLLPPKRKSSFRHLKQGIQEFHRKYVLVPADKAANNVVVVCRLHYVNTLKQELDGTRAYLETDTDKVSVVNAHLVNDLPVKFSVCVNEGQDKLPTMYWLPKLHKRPYKARFIANSSSCTTTELSKLLTSCLTAIKSHVIRYCETVYETSNKNWFWSIKNSGDVLSKLKCKGFRATSLSTYDFSTLYTTLPNNLIKEKLLDLIEWTFKRALKNYGSLYLACNDRKAFFTSSDQSRYTLWSCQNVSDAMSYLLDFIYIRFRTNCWNSDGYKLRTTRS